MNNSPPSIFAAVETTVTERTHRVLVLGGTGFIGRHVVAALHSSRARVLIGSREPSRHERKYPDAEFSAVRFENLLVFDGN